MDTYRFRKQIHKLPGKVIHAIPLPEPDVTEGQGARGQIGEICRKNGYKQVLLVTDRTLHALGFETPIVASLEAAGVGCTVFDDIHSEPIREVCHPAPCPRMSKVTLRHPCICAIRAIPYHRQ